jgi:type III restriction enzyme
MLASVVGGLGNAVVLWTSRSSAVIDQTYENLNGKYRHLLGTNNVRVVRRVSSQSEWRSLIDSPTGLTIWLLTVGLWNEAEHAQTAGSDDARLNLHRIQRDWAGETSPWDQLRTQMTRPLWVVSDESHNQSATQLDQLAALKPKGFFMASATPVANELFVRRKSVLADDPIWAPISKASVVPIKTADVVEQSLLKTTLDVIDLNSGTEESLDAALTALEELDEAVSNAGVGINPRVVYVVEASNPTRGSLLDARPVVIWKYLRSKGVPADEIVIYTNTKKVPDEAEQVSSLARLHPRYRHIIFNMSLQEGWDDPEAYVCYFDGLTKSYNRIKQIVGRVLRQPDARRFDDDRLNTATLIINTPGDSYNDVIEELQKELRLYSSDDDPDFIAVKVRTKTNPLTPVPVKPELVGSLTLTRRELRAPNMLPVVNRMRTQGRRPWSDEDLRAKGRGQRQTFDLAEEEVLAREYFEVLLSARTRNSEYLRRRIQQSNRSCVISIDASSYSGAAYEQWSCMGSAAQDELDELAGWVVGQYEAGVRYGTDSDPARARWTVGEYRPRRREMITFQRAAHSSYSRSDLNKDELEFAQALDAYASSVWARNPTTPGLGYSIPLPAKVGESSNFYPDFLWWVGGRSWAIDTTGAHLMGEKVRGKLFAVDDPTFALVTRGDMQSTGIVMTGSSGWTLVTSRGPMGVQFAHFGDLDVLLAELATADGGAVEIQEEP